MKPAQLGLMVLFIMALGAAASVLECQAVTQTDFSGTWNADLAKSRFVHGSPLPKRWYAITQQDERQLVRTETFVGDDGKATSQKMVFTFDGKENRNLFEDGIEVRTTCHWKGKSLIIEGTITFDPNTRAVWTEELTLSPDGKSLHATSSVKFPGDRSNDTDITYVRGH